MEVLKYYFGTKSANILSSFNLIFIADSMHEVSFN